MRRPGGQPVVAGLGPCIDPCCYAFGPRDLDAAAVVARPRGPGPPRPGPPALDLPAAVGLSWHAAGVAVVVDVDECTAAAPGYFSHRARGDEARQALFVWRQD